MIKKIRHFAYRLKYINAHRLSLKNPVDIMLELSSACNLSCGYCYHSSPKTLPFNPGIMTSSTAAKIIRQAATAGVNSLKFNAKGEPTLNKDFFKIISLARSLKSGSTFQDLLINSNFYFNPDREDLFLGFSQLTKVKVSFDSFDRGVFQAQRVGAKFETVLRNIDIFYDHKERKKNRTKIVIQAVRTERNKDEDIYKIAKQRWPGCEVSIRDMVAGRVGGVKGFKDRDTSSRIPCRQAFARLIFNSRGDAHMCCPDIGEKLKLGNIHDEKLVDMFNSRMANRVRDKLLDGSAFRDIDVCKSCSSFETYKGYKANWKS